MKTIVTTSTGPVRGHERDGILEFLGIPYAQPPVGGLRLKRARPVTPWQETLDAESYGPAAIQFDEGKNTGSEDCLTVNVQRPLEGERLPVFIYIHGGGYNTGAASVPLYNGRAFAEDGLVFFSFQYRMNVFGFMDFAACPGCEDFESNCGLSDQIAAMTWIHENLEAFGGDPERVTICGESAGGASVITMLAVPAVKGFFQQAIVESGLPNLVASRELAGKYVGLFLEGMGWTQEDLPKLKTIDPFLPLKGNAYLSGMLQERYPGILGACPVIDDLLPERPIDAIRKGSAKGVRLIIGTNHDEGAMFVHPEGTVFPNSWRMIAEMFEKNGHADAIPDIINYYHPAAHGQIAREENAQGGDPFVRFATDYAFRMPSVKAAEAQREYGEVWMYRYDLVTKSAKESGLGACHAFELPAVFSNRDFPFTQSIFEGEPESLLEELIREMHGDWVRFAKAGAPDPERWPRYKGYQTKIRVFDRQSRTEEADLTPLMKVWGDLRFYE